MVVSKKSGNVESRDGDDCDGRGGRDGGDEDER